MEETKAFCKQNGYVLTLFGRNATIRTSSIQRSIRAFNERAPSMPGCRHGADIIRRACAQWTPALAKRSSTPRMLLQVHDEAGVRIARRRGRQNLPVVKKVMEHARCRPRSIGAARRRRPRGG